MLEIYKYPITVDDYFHLDLPAKAKVLKVDEQNHHPRMWVLLDPQEEKVPWKFLCVGTGIDIREKPEDLKHISTFQRGAYVWHVFEVRK